MVCYIVLRSSFPVCRHAWIRHCCTFLSLWSAGHRRRIKAEEKAKVVAAVWGAEFIQFLAALAILN